MVASSRDVAAHLDARYAFALAVHGAKKRGDMQRTCACCNEKGVCEKDLADRPDDPVWKNYCPNAVTLESLSELKARSSG